jgi:hypothetical protein
MQEERYGTRDRTYSAWHRRLSTKRYVGLDRAQLLSMIDLDGSLYVEYDDGTKEPLALVETAMDVGQVYKNATVTTKLAQKAGIPCYCVLYTMDTKRNPADPTCQDISKFRIRRLWPAPEAGWRSVTPEEWAKALLNIRSWAGERVGAEPANDEFYEMPQKQESLFEQQV